MDYVAPRVGAWIETHKFLQSARLYSSHPVWVRGLKPLCALCLALPCRSHPVWVRGLKLVCWQLVNFCNMSHPVWVRGLKHAADTLSNLGTLVAPRVGAWIETLLRKYPCLKSCRTPCGCVD